MGFINRNLEKIFEYERPVSKLKKGLFRTSVSYADNSGRIMDHFYDSPQFSEDELSGIAEAINKSNHKNSNINRKDLLELTRNNFDWRGTQIGKIKNSKIKKSLEDTINRASSTGKVTVAEYVSRKDNKDPYFVIISNGILGNPESHKSPNSIMHLQSSKYYKILVDMNTSDLYVPTITRIGDVFGVTSQDYIKFVGKLAPEEQIRENSINKPSIEIFNTKNLKVETVDSNAIASFKSNKKFPFSKRSKKSINYTLPIENSSYFNSTNSLPMWKPVETSK